jgi:hypothetical protein
MRNGFKDGSRVTPPMYSFAFGDGGRCLVDVEERWEQLFRGLEEAALIDTPNEIAVARVNVLLGSLHLVQPFNWMSWGAPFPTPDEIDSLSLENCIRHITRVSRADRTNEGVLWSTVQSGVLLAICKVAYRRAEGKTVGSLSDLAK